MPNGQTLIPKRETPPVLRVGTFPDPSCSCLPSLQSTTLGRAARIAPSCFADERGFAREAKRRDNGGRPAGEGRGGGGKSLSASRNNPSRDFGLVARGPRDHCDRFCSLRRARGDA